jgi:hypothetical protein
MFGPPINLIKLKSNRREELSEKMLKPENARIQACGGGALESF